MFYFSFYNPDNEKFDFMFRNIMEVVFPYDLITQFEIDHLGAKAKLEIFSRCKSSLDDADTLIALLDSPYVDDAWEIG
jgi:nucleoside 2-deoxyribosyltransferase